MKLQSIDPAGCDKFTDTAIDPAVRRPWWRLAVAGVFGAGLMVWTAVAHGGSAETAQGVRTFGLAISASDVAKLRAGAVVSKEIRSDVDQETATLHLVRIGVPASFVRHVYLDQTVSMVSAEALEFGILDAARPALSLADLTLDATDIDSLRRCEVGDCGVKLDADWIRRFHEEIDWSRPAAAQQAALLYRVLLADYARAYRRGGNGSLTRYHDKKRAVDVAAESAGILRQSPYLCQDLPELCTYVLDYPDTRLEDLRDLVFWMKDDAGARKNVTSLVHQMIYVPPGSADLVVLDKQIYANHYFESALGLTRIVPGGDARSVYLVHVYRARIDSLRGWGLFHGRIRRGVRGEIGRRLAATKRRLESRWDAVASAWFQS